MKFQLKKPKTAFESQFLSKLEIEMTRFKVKKLHRLVILYLPVLALLLMSQGTMAAQLTSTPDSVCGSFANPRTEIRYNWNDRSKSWPTQLVFHVGGEDPVLVNNHHPLFKPLLELVKNGESFTLEWCEFSDGSFNVGYY